MDPDIANCIPVSKMFETLNPFETSDLQDYLSNIFGSYHTNRAFSLYKIGMMRFGDWGNAACSGNLIKVG